MVATVKDINESTKLDKLKWCLVLVMLAVAVWANLHFVQFPLLYRVAAGLVVATVATLIAWQTRQGRQAVEFMKLSRAELRKVIWPSREETVRTTLVVMVAVFVMAILLWGIDTLLFWVVGQVTG